MRLGHSAKGQWRSLQLGHALLLVCSPVIDELPQFPAKPPLRGSSNVHQGGTSPTRRLPGVSQLELRGSLRPRTDVGNRDRGRGGALRGLSPAVVKPGGVRPGVAHQVGGNGEIVPGGEQRRGEAAPEHVR